MPDFDASWEAARCFQIERALEASPAQRLEWLEEAIDFAYRTGALTRRAPDADRSQRTRA
jgi:hypothetical protein